MKQRKHILIVVSVLVVTALGLGGWYLLSDRQPPELTTVATYQAECGRAVTVEELVARVADHSSYEVTLSGDGAVSQDGNRILHMSDDLYRLLRRERARQAERKLALGDAWPDTGMVAVDAKGNRVQQTVTVTAVDKTPPELTVKTIKTTVGKKIDYKKAVKAVDVVDGDLTDAVQVSDIYVNHKQVGSYTAIYTVTDQAGNRAEARGLVLVNPVKADKLQLSSKELYLNGNQYAALTPTVTPKTWAGTVEWTSSDPDVATVSDGLVTWVAPGTCTITAKADKQKATCAVTCGAVALSSVRLDRSSVTLEVGTMTILQAETSPTNWSGEVTWKSSKPKVKNGVVTALKPGKCKITAQAGDGKAVCTVICKEKSLTTEWKEWWQDVTEGGSHNSKH